MANTESNTNATGFGALGSINNASFEGMVIKTSSKGGKWAQVTLDIGGSEVRCKVFPNKKSNPIEDLEAYVEGEQIPNIFGKISSSLYEGKVYNSLQILKVQTESREKDGFRLTGRVTVVNQTKFAHFIDVDTTDNGYESWLRVELPKGTTKNPYRVGQKLREVAITPKGKYGTWTIVSPPTVAGDDDDAPDNGADTKDSVSKNDPLFDC